MNRRLAAFTVLAALALGFLLVRTDTAEATSAHKNSFISAYPAAANTRLDSCSTCHTSAPNLNSYGADLKAAGTSFSAIALKDSDGDGVNNQDEIRALTFPGSASDKPVTTITTVATTTPTTAPSTTVSTTTPTTAPSTTVPTTPTTTASTTVTTTPSALSPTSAASESIAVIFPMTYDLGEAGTVTIDLVDGVLNATVDAADGWDVDIEYEDEEVEVELRNGETEIEIEAEFEDGQVKVKIESEDDDHDDDDDDGRGHENHDEDEKRGRGHHDDDDDDDDDD